MKDRSNGSPSHWVSTTLEEIAEVRLGRQRSPERATGDHMHPYMRAANVTWDGISLHDVKEMDFTPKEFAIYQLRRGDILLAEASGSASEVGKAAIWNEEIPGCCFQNTLLRVRAHETLVRFLHLHLTKDAMSGAFAAASRGVGIHHLGAEAMCEWKIRLPPLGEQNRILEEVESYFTRLEDAVAALERVEQNLKRYRASVLKAAVEGRLVPTEAALAKQEGRTCEPAAALLERILDERRRRWSESGKKGKYQEPSLPDTTDLPALPEGWCWATVDQLAEVGTGATPKRGHDRFWKNGTIPWVTSSVVNARRVMKPSELVTEAALAETNLTLYGPGTLLVAMYGEGKTRGMVSELGIEAATNQALAAIVLEGTAAQLRQWLLGFFLHNYMELRRSASGGVQPNLNLGIIKSLVVPLPPAEEQRRITSEVESILSRVESTERLVTLQKARLSRLRQSVLKWAFEARLADQDPSDEPASVLLERIKAERETVKPAKAARAQRGAGKKQVRA